MPIPIRVTSEELAAMPEPLRKEYAEMTDSPGTYAPQLEFGDTGLGLAKVGELQTALNKERSTARDATNKLKAFEGIDAAKAKAALEFHSKYEQGELNDEQAARLQAREKQLLEKYEAQAAAITKKLADNETAATAREKHLLSQLDLNMRRSTVRAAIAKHGGSLRLLEPVVLSHSRMIEEDGKFITQMLGEDGNPILSRRAGSTTEPMDADEYVEMMKTDREFAQAFSGSGSSGAGTGSDNNKNAAGQIVLTKAQAKDVRTFRDAQERAKKAGTSVVIAD